MLIRGVPRNSMVKEDKHKKGDNRKQNRIVVLTDDNVSGRIEAFEHVLTTKLLEKESGGK